MWATREQARAHWSDAPADDDVLDTLLAAAFPACEGYAPPLPEGDPVPPAYMLANVYHAREIWNASQRGEQDVIGIGEYAIRARPLTAAVKALLRPKTVRWTVG